MRGRMRAVAVEEDEADAIPELLGQVAPRAERAAGPAVGDGSSLRDDRVSKAAMGLLLLSIKQLSQRTLVAASTCFTFALAASAFFLWWTVLGAPTPLQLTGLGMYSGFALALEFVRRR